MPECLFDFLTSRRSRLSKAESLQTLEICAEGVGLAGNMINQTVNLFLQNSPKLEKVVAKFPLHETESQQRGTMEQMLDYLRWWPGDEDDDNFDLTIPAGETIYLLNAKIGKASRLTWQGHPANLIGTATWQAQKGKVLADSKQLEMFPGELQCCKKEVADFLLPLPASRGSADFKAMYEDLRSKVSMMRILGPLSENGWSRLPQMEKEICEKFVRCDLALYDM